MHAKWQLVVVLLITTFLYALHDAAQKYQSVIFAVVLLVWARYIVQLIIMLIAITPLMGREIIATKRPGLMIFRALMQVGSALFVQFALKHMPLAETAALLFVSPLLVALLSGVMLGERLHLHDWLATIAGFAGVLLIARPGGTVVGIGVVYALTAAFCNALYQLFTRKLTASEPPLRQLFYSTLAGAVTMSLIVPEYWISELPTLRQSGLLVGAACSVAVGHFLFIDAARKTPVAILATLLYFKVVWSVLLGLLVFGQLPGFLSVVGMLIIGASGLSVALYKPRLGLVNTP